MSSCFHYFTLAGVRNRSSTVAPAEGPTESEGARSESWANQGLPDLEADEPSEGGGGVGDNKTSSVDERTRTLFDVEELDRSALALTAGRIMTLRVTGPAGLGVTVGISDTAHVSFPEMELEIPPGTGRLTTLENFVDGHNSNLKSARSSLSGPQLLMMDALIAELDDYVAGREPFTMVVRDCFGRSFVRSTNRDITVTSVEYERTAAECKEWGVAMRPVASGPGLSASAPSSSTTDETSANVEGAAVTEPAWSKDATGLTYDSRMEAHSDPSGDHPEQPARISAIFHELERLGLVDRCVLVPARVATDEELMLVHDADHVKRTHEFPSMNLEDLMLAASSYNSIYLNRDSTGAALLSCGSVVELTQRVLAGQLRNAFAVVRPPGHHAEAECAMGFCLYNNVAVAAAAALKGGAQRILIADWDVHHGNGTQRMFEEDPRVFYFSVHRYDNARFYPGTDYGGPQSIGTGAGRGYSANVGWNTRHLPRPCKYGDAEFIASFTDVLIPIAKAYKPDLVLVSAGFDAATGDPLGGCDVTPYGYARMTSELMAVCDGKLIVALEGGYNLRSISASAAAVVRVLLGEEVSSTIPNARAPYDVGYESITRVQEALKDYWTFPPPRTDLEVVERVNEGEATCRTS